MNSHSLGGHSHTPAPAKFHQAKLHGVKGAHRSRKFEFACHFSQGHVLSPCWSQNFLGSRMCSPSLHFANPHFGPYRERLQSEPSAFINITLVYVFDLLCCFGFGCVDSLPPLNVLLERFQVCARQPSLGSRLQPDSWYDLHKPFLFQDSS